MNKYALMHIPDSNYCFATGERELVIRIRCAKEDREARIFLIYGNKYEYQTKQIEVEMQLGYSDEIYDYYETKLKLNDVRVAYIFRINDNGKDYYFSEDGLTDTYNFKESFYNFFQMPYINRNDLHEEVDWMKNAVFYQIFVDRFYQGNHTKDASYIDMKWGDKPTPKNFAGGDLRGIIEKIPYLEKLGITALYLTPIFLSKSNHKYDISNYKIIDPQFGTEDDLKELVAKCHEKKIKVVLDAVFNHCSEDLPEFQDVMRNGSKSRFYDWFLIDGDYPDKEKLNYECFASCNYMPKLNTAVAGVQQYLLDIATYWIKIADIDGWRLDVSDEVSHDFWRKFRRTIKKEKADAVIIGENWHDAYPYLMGDQYDSIMNYAFTKACLDYFTKENFTAEDMSNKLNGLLMRNTEPVNRMMLNLLDSHDTLRFFTEVKENKDKLLAAIALSIVFPGATCIYYGTEICTPGGYDPDSRRCFEWNESKWDMNVWEQIHQLISIKSMNIIKSGNVKIYSKDGLLCVERISDNEMLQILVNQTQKEIIIKEPSGIVISNKYDKKLRPDGYLITRRKINEEKDY